MPGSLAERSGRARRRRDGGAGARAPRRRDRSADRAAGELGPGAAGTPRRRGRCVPAAAAAGRPARPPGVGAPLDLDEDQKLAASGDEVDLADRGRVAPGQDAKAAGAQQPGGQRLGEAAGALAPAPAHASVRRQRQRAAVELVGAAAGGGGDRGGGPARLRLAAAPRAARRRARQSATARRSAPGRTRSPPRSRRAAARRPHRSAASSGRLPWRCSSWSLVSSRATAAGARAEHVGGVGETLGEPLRRFVQDQRRRHGGQLPEHAPPGGAAGRQEALEQEPVGRQPRGDECGEHRRRAGDRDRPAFPGPRAARTSLKPGSEIAGVPASLTRATLAPAASRASSSGRAASALCSW